MTTKLIARCNWRTIYVESVPTGKPLARHREEHDPSTLRPRTTRQHQPRSRRARLANSGRNSPRCRSYNHTEEQNGYTSHAGLHALRERIAADYVDLGLTPERVITTAGSQEALYLALMTLVDEGDEVLLPDPGFVAYPTIVRMAGGRPVYYRLPATQDFGFDIDQFRNALTPNTKIVVCISPFQPDGSNYIARATKVHGQCAGWEQCLRDKR